MHKIVSDEPFEVGTSMNKPNQTLLPKEVFDSLAILNRGSESVRAVLMAEDNRFSRALEDLQRLAIQEKIPIAIVGGLGAIRYGYPAATQDIDIAVAQNQLAKLILSAHLYGFKILWESLSGWHTLTHGEVEINIVPEGGKARKTAPTCIPSPQILGVQQGLDYALLPGWMELKISSGRQKDRAHVVEVMKKTDESSLTMVRSHLVSVHQNYVQIFDQLYEDAKAEIDQENERGTPPV